MRELLDNKWIIDFDQESIDIRDLQIIILDALSNGYKTVKLSIEQDSITEDNEEGTINYYPTAKLIFEKF
jgi:hypothetical protein